MDGGSTDRSIEIIREFEILLKKNSSIKKYKGLDFHICRNLPNAYINCRGISYRWISEKDNGQAHAINKGIGLSGGEIVAYINSDDRYEEYAFKIAVERFKEDRTIDVLYGNAVFIDERGNNIELYYTKDIYTNDIFGECFICQPSVFLRKSVFASVGCFNEKIHNSFDYEFWIRLMVRGHKFRFTTNVLAFSRVHKDTKTLKNRKEIYLENLAINKRYSGKFHKSWRFQLSKEIPFIIKMIVGAGNLFHEIIKKMTTVIVKLTSLYYPYLLTRAINKKYHHFFDNQ